MTGPPTASMPVEYLTPLIEARAVAVQSTLAERGQHRAPSIPDLLIAATAELAELTEAHLVSSLPNQLPGSREPVAG